MCNFRNQYKREVRGGVISASHNVGGIRDEKITRRTVLKRTQNSRRDR